MQDGVDGFLVAVHDVQHAVGQTGFLHQLGHADARRRIFFRRLQHERVAARQRHGKHPHRDHRRKIEGRDRRDHAQRLPNDVAIDAGGDVLEREALHQRRRAGGDLDALDAAPHAAAADLFGVRALEQLGRADGKFDHLDAALNRSHRVEKHLAVLFADQRGQFLLVLFDELTKLVEDARAPHGRHVAPGGKRRRGRLDRRIDVGGVRKRHGADYLAGRRVRHLAEAGAF